LNRFDFNCLLACLSAFVPAFSFLSHLQVKQLSPEGIQASHSLISQDIHCLPVFLLLPACPALHAHITGPCASLSHITEGWRCCCVVLLPSLALSYPCRPAAASRRPTLAAQVAQAAASAQHTRWVGSTCVCACACVCLCASVRVRVCVCACVIWDGAEFHVHRQQPGA
jgi:hypothetical protein